MQDFWQLFFRGGEEVLWQFLNYSHHSDPLNNVIRKYENRLSVKMISQSITFFSIAL